MATQHSDTASFDVEDLNFDVLPGGANEPVLHVGAVVAVVFLVYATPAY